MEIVRDNSQIGMNSVVTIGSFDGVHYGHRSILEKLMELSKEYRASSVVLTMYPHPRKALNLDISKLKLLNSLDEKAYLLSEFGVDFMYVAKFDKAFSELNGEEFVRQYIVDKLRAKAVIIGYDHRFGHNRQNGYDFMQAMGMKYGFEVVEIPKHEIDQADISSTTIRNLLSEGDVVKANKYLCTPYFFMAEVDKDGYLVIDEEMKLIPPAGDYLVQLEWDNEQLSSKITVFEDKRVRLHLQKSFDKKIIIKIINCA